MPSSSTSVIAAGAAALIGTVYSVWVLQRKRQIIGGTSTNDCIYLDYNGTTPIYPVITAAMMPYMTEHFGNPGSTHVYGDAPRKAIETARRQILYQLLGADAATTPLSACVFTACGTEADNMAIHIALQQHTKTKPKTKDLPHIVTTNIEHPAVEKCLQHYATAGRCTVTYVPCQPNGCVRSQDMIAAVKPNTILVALMLANNESGALQPVRDVALYCRQHGILCFTDAAQAAGKVSVRLPEMGEPDMVTIVGHKLGAPKGIACLYVRPGVLTSDAAPLLHGGGQEFGWRGGTENVPYIVGLGVAAERAAARLRRNQQHMEVLRSRLLQRLANALGDESCSMVVHGPKDKSQRLPNTLSIGFPGIQSAALLQSLRRQVAASAGATCHAAGPISAVLRAMRIPDDVARGTVRLSLGPSTTADEVDRAAELLLRAVERQRSGEK